MLKKMIDKEKTMEELRKFHNMLEKMTTKREKKKKWYEYCMITLETCMMAVMIQKETEVYIVEKDEKEEEKTEEESEKEG